MVTTRKKLAAKTAAKKPAAKTAAKKTAAKKTSKKAAKKAVKKVVKKAAAKTAKTVKKVAVKKAVAKKVAAKSSTTKASTTAKPKAGKSVKPAAASRAVLPTPKVPPPSPAPKLASAPVASTPAMPPISLKGLRGVSGAKAARIAQIVAESFLPKPAAAKPAAESAPRDGSAYEPGSALDAAHKAAAVLFSKKAEEVVLMDLRNLSTVADYYLIATCQNEPQMRSILGTVQRALSRDGIKSLRSEYMPGVRWAVVDYGDLILHLFEKQTRGFYSLERLWADAPSTTLKASDYALPADEDGTDADEDGDL
jgi:ribosome-associated protein